MYRETDFSDALAKGQIRTHRPTWSEVYERRDGTFAIAFRIDEVLIHLGKATIVPEDQWTLGDELLATTVLDAPTPVISDPLKALNDPNFDVDRFNQMVGDPNFRRLVELTNARTIAIEGVDRLVDDLGVAVCLADPRELASLLRNILENAHDLLASLTDREVP